jgi:UDP-N-acetylglucosamine transferase subunit ALG13
MPRRWKFGEHVNDHQLEIAGALAAQGRLRQVETPEALWSALQEVTGVSASAAAAVPALVSFLEDWLQQWAERRNSRCAT